MHCNGQSLTLLVSMRIDVSRFGACLLSRPKAQEAFAQLEKEEFGKLLEDELVELDLSTVQVLTPGWMHEMWLLCCERFGDRVKIVHENNTRVAFVLEFLKEFHKEDFKPEFLC